MLHAARQRHSSSTVTSDDSVHVKSVCVSLQSSLSFGEPQLAFSMDFLFLRRDTKTGQTVIMFCEWKKQEARGVRMMSPSSPSALFRLCHALS